MSLCGNLIGLGWNYFGCSFSEKLLSWQSRRRGESQEPRRDYLCRRFYEGGHARRIGLGLSSENEDTPPAKVASWKGELGENSMVACEKPFLVTCTVIRAALQDALQTFWYE